MAEGNGKSWTELFRIITPVLCLIITGFAAVTYGRIGDIDSKLFLHLTNAELHFPRQQVVTKSEYDVVQKMRDQQFATLSNQVAEIKQLICDRRGY